MPVCQRCGEENPERARFCHGCAALLAAPVSARREERKRVSVLFYRQVRATAYLREAEALVAASA